MVGLETALDRFAEHADDRALGIEGVEVVLDTGDRAERRWIDDIRRDVFSVSKTVTSLAIGMLDDDGLLGLDDPILMHLPELADSAAPGSETMTVRHLLRMTAGNGYRWLDADADHPGDPARDFLATPLVAEPGTAYHYAGGNSYVLGRIVHSLTGLDLRDFLLPRLFAPLGIRNPQWLRCPLGFPLGAIGCTCAPQRSAGSLRSSCTEVSGMVSISYLPVTSHGWSRRRPRQGGSSRITGPMGCMSGCAAAIERGAWTASTVSSGSCCPITTPV